MLSGTITAADDESGEHKMWDKKWSDYVGTAKSDKNMVKTLFSKNMVKASTLTGSFSSNSNSN